MVLTFIATFRFTVASSVTPFLIGEETEVQRRIYDFICIALRNSENCKG